jgi:hypothetical protein
MSGSDYIRVSGRTIYATLFYCRNEGEPNEILVELCDVRAADGLRITYDFDRDGWVIQQAQVVEWDDMDEACDYDPKWKEVAFLKAWGSVTHKRDGT